MGESNFKLQTSKFQHNCSGVIASLEKQSLNVTEIASRSALAMTDSSNFKIPNELEKFDYRCGERLAW